MSAILHIDTSGSTALVMVAVDGKPIAQKQSETERDHAGRINGLIADVLSAADTSLDRLDAIAVCNGPGSYTGLRIGLATAKGYCYVLQKPLILHNRLHLMLHELSGAEVNKLALIPARKGEYYFAMQGVDAAIVPTHITTEDLLNIALKLEHPIAIIGTMHEDLAPLQVDNYVSHNTLDPDVWAGLTLISLQQHLFADIAYAAPYYLKPAYITTPRADRAK